ncbi:Uu.00g088560.m01.CDS01 [Anthostomella pinea]|uniref:Uu.00g088560.m01.CDS01 n=1 Tax=Anthostomella pinea TaxID=933095 RepID=A0AAI8VMJ5_9PEZI|nr:Uu.00g088560.m01.CDS01 [Anthostomella pinea]
MSSSDGNFGNAVNGPMSLENLFGSTWPTILQACLNNNCDGDFRSFRDALDPGSNRPANTQALLIFNALEEALQMIDQKQMQLKTEVHTGDALNQNLRDQLAQSKGQVAAYEGGIGNLARSFEQGIQGIGSRGGHGPSSLGGARLKLNVEKKKYSTEYSKILYAVSRLGGEEPHRWEWKDTDTLFDWLERAYDSHDRSGDASREMDDLKQKNSAFSVFLSEFLVLASDLGLNDKAKVKKLKKKVNNELQSAMIKNIADYAHHTGNKNPFSNNPFNKDNNKNHGNNNKNNNNKNNNNKNNNNKNNNNKNNNNKNKNNKNNNNKNKNNKNNNNKNKNNKNNNNKNNNNKNNNNKNNNNKNNNNKNNNNKNNNNKNNQNQHPPRAQQTPAPAGDPMDIDTVKLRRLSTTERQRRIDQGLCLYCGKDDHVKRDCPDTPSSPAYGPLSRQNSNTFPERPGSAPPGNNNTNPFWQGHPQDLRIRAIGWKGNADDWPGSSSSSQYSGSYLNTPWPGIPAGHGGHQHDSSCNAHGSSAESKG